MRYLKLLLSWLFRIAVQTRAEIYQRGILKSRRLPHPVICVGNLTVGGTGKTPLVAYLAVRLKEAGLAPAILSRGYKGKPGHSPSIVSDGSKVLGTPENCGDEPYLLARKLEGVIVAVGKDRFEAGQLVGKQSRDTVFILDDGFQHLKLHRDLDLLLVDGSRSLKGEALLPAGRLREPRSAMARADAILVTRDHLIHDLKGLVEEIRLWNPTAPIFPFSHEIDEVYELASQKRFSLSDFRGKKVIALAAIGNPKQFLNDLVLAGIDLEDQFLYPDHHRFSQMELSKALKRCQQRSAACVLTTEKDAVRLQRLEFEEGQIFVVSIKAKTRDQATFVNWVLQKLNKKSL